MVKRGTIPIMEAIVESSGLCKIYPRWNISRAQLMLGNAIRLANQLGDSKFKSNLLNHLRTALACINTGEEDKIRIEAVKQLNYAANETNKIAVTK